VEAGVASYEALAVATSDGPVRIEAFDRAGRQAIAHRSPIASITKPVTAVAVLQLVESGDLVLHEPLSTYLPEFRPAATVDGEPDEPITAWHLLTHTSGLEDLGAWFDPTRTPDHVVSSLCIARPEFPPGSAYRYATDTFYLLAALIGRLSGLPYREYLAERLFAPLGMTRTSFDPDEHLPSVTMDGSFGGRDASEADMRAVFRMQAMPGGGLWSTPEDMLRFGRAMLGGGTLEGTRVLGLPFVDLMLRRHTERVRERGTGRSPDYGLGWGFPGLGRGMPSSDVAFAHAGGTGSILLVDPPYDLVVVHLRNDWNATMKATDEVVQAVYGALS
jgi:CubicO group peptidase (beta-lactamase class C family)